MAKILVADDNSNIQKMVGLALKDHGIDVVAVGNGEAAVRKISDVRPDLVLADVFMPVRNGYEVCRYVKEDSALAHIPVILLVGAFDPLDEQEAQRVGADGVLKKPFVPPDPLISMVKSALVRSHSGQPIAAKPSTAAMVGSPTQITQPANGTPSVSATPAPAAPAEPEVFDDIPPKPEQLNIESSGKPLAFGSLLETPTPTDATEDDASFVSRPSGPERDWSKVEEVEEEEEEEDSTSTWRRDGGTDEFASEPEASEEKPARAKRKESWTPTREKVQDLIEAAVEPDLPPPPPMPSFPRPMSAPPLAPPSAPAKEAGPVASETIAAPKKSAPVIAEQKAPPPPVVEANEQESFVSEAETSAPEETTPAPDPAATAGGASWFTTSSTPWDVDAKSGGAAPTWEAPPESTAPVATAPVAPEVPAPPPEPIHIDGSMPDDFVSEEMDNGPVSYIPDPALVRNEVVSSNPLPELISDGSISPETVENIREQTTNALETVAPPVIEKAQEAVTQAPEQPSPDMDALVAKVLAKMSPEMLQAVTREILKPVVEAMLRDEIGAKKQ